MATANPLEEILNSEVDESAISAVVGSLESQLASPTIRDSSQQSSTSSVVSNHVGGLDVASSISTVQSHVHGLVPGKVLLSTNSQTIQLNAPNATKNALLNPQTIAGNSLVTSSLNQLSVGVSSFVTAALTQHLPNSVTSHSNVLHPSHHVSGVTLNNGTSVTLPVPLNPKPVTVAVGSTNAGTVILGTSSNSVPGAVISNQTIGANGSVVQSPVVDVKPIVYTSTIEAKPPLGLPGLVTTVKEESETKPQVVYSVVNRSSTPLSRQDIKPEVKFVATRPPSVNAIVSSANLQTRPLTPSTSVITLTKPMASTQTVTVMRPPIATQTAASSSIQIVTMSGAVTPKPSPNVTNAQKTLAPRIQGAPVRIAAQPQVMPAVRPPSNVNAITIPPNMFPPGSYLVRNEQGQMMVVHGSPSSTASTVQQSPQTVRLQRPATPGTITTAASIQVQQQQPQQQQQIRTTVPRPINVSAAQTVNTVNVRPAAAATTNMTINRGAITPVSRVTPVINSHTPAQPVAAPIQPAPVSQAALQQAAQRKQDDLENMRKCKNFLSTLLRLAASQPASTVKNVRALIQGLIDGKVDPEHFTAQLQVELKSSPQPYLVPFLRKSLPLLRASMMSGKMKIESIQAPAIRTPGVVHATMPGALPASMQANSPLATGATTTHVRPPMQPYQIVSSQAGGKPVVIPPGMHTVRSLAPAPNSQHTSATAAALQAAGNKHPHMVRPVASLAASKLQIKPAAVRATLATTKAASPAVAASRDKRKYDSLKDDDDINDVATMGGVNLTEESRNIMATNSELMAGQLRSCKDEVFLSSKPLAARLKAMAHKHGLDDVSGEAVTLMSHAVEARLRTVLEKVAVLAEHRLEIYKMDSRYEVSKEVRPQLKFLEELDKQEKKRHEEAEREVLLRAAKSRSKHEDPEQLKLKEKAKAMQQAELEEMRQREANLTALAAIGPRKKRKLDGTDAPGGSPGASSASGSGTSTPRATLVRPRIKRVNLRDLLFVMEDERETSKSNLLYKTFLK